MKPNNTDIKKQNLLWKLHHWAGLYAGIVIGILCFTGAVAVFIPEINLVIQKNYYSVSSAKPAFGAIPKIDSAFTRARKDYPKMSDLLIDMPDKPGQTVIFSFQVKGNDKASSKSYVMFVDPVQDKILGIRDKQNSFVNFLRQIHVRLYEGIWGRQLVGLAGIAFIIVTITGFMIYGNFMKKQTYPTIRKKNTRILMADWHKILGISALAFNFIIACTGAWLGLQPKLVKWFNIKTPNDFEGRIMIDKKTDTQTAVHWNEVFRILKQEFPELKPNYIRVSEDGTAVVEIHGSIDGQIYETNANALVISKLNYKPLYKYDVRTGTFGEKLFSVQEALHYGDFGGLGLKILYSILGLISAFLSISGFVIYLYRTDKKKSRKISPLKTTFIYSVLILLILTCIALISMFIGYNQAAALASFIVNGTLITLVVYATTRYFIKEKKSQPTVYEREII